MEKLNSRSLALALAAGYLVVSALIGTALVTTRNPDRTPSAEAVRTSYEDTNTATKTKTPARTTRRTTTTTTTPTGYHRRVTGAYDLVTAIPADWTTRTGDVSTVQVARSTAHPGFELRYGGAPPEEPAKTLFQRITTAHEGKLGKNSYDLERLRDTTLRGYPAVEWTYTTAPNGTPQFCTGTWWEASGIEYVLLVVSPRSERTQAEKMLDLMTTNAKP